MGKHAPQKKKKIPGKTKPHVNNKLRSTAMKRSRLENMVNKTKSHDDIISYKTQRNLVVKLNNKLKFKNFNKHDPNKQAKPF